MTTNPKIFEAWFTLMSEAMRGTAEAQEAFKMLSQMSGSSPQGLNDWIARFMPGVMGTTPDTQSETFESWLEEWQRVMGVVPRSRYLALLEKQDILQRRLEQAEQTIKTLQTKLSSKDFQESETKKVADMWGTMFEDTLKMQAEWMKNWTETNSEPDSTELHDPAEDDAASKGEP